MTIIAVDLDFEDPDLHAKLDELGPEGYDHTSFGVVALDNDLVCVAYNATEQEYAGLDPERVIGRHFFEEVAPCMNNFLVSDKFRDDGRNDETIPYTLSVRLAPTQCRLRMLVQPGDGPNYLVVDWSSVS
ncbi:MAG: PAS domain-containing protein [Actinomycetota bacterium]